MSSGPVRAGNNIFVSVNTATKRIKVKFIVRKYSQKIWPAFFPELKTS
jgi:hypothetical protein